jgi:hypothetical protein
VQNQLPIIGTQICAHPRPHPKKAL